MEKSTIVIIVFVVLALILGIVAICLVTVGPTVLSLAYLKTTSAATQLIATSVQTTVQARTIEISTGGITYDITNDKVTVDKDGVYEVSLNGFTDATTNIFSTWLRVAGVDAPFTGLNALTNSINLSTLVRLTSGSSFDIQTYQSSGTDYSIVATGGRTVSLQVLFLRAI